MSSILSMVLTATLSYLLGSIPFSLLIGRLKGIDLRKHGSGNLGATNVARTLGAKWGACALLADAMKGLAAVSLIPVLITVTSDLSIHQKVLAAVMSVIGHMFSCWIGFRGGKGVATALGAVSILAPWGTLIAFVMFCLTVFVKRIISLGSMVAALTFAIAQLLVYRSELWTSQNWSLGAFSILVPALIIFQHRSNIGRLMKGEEKQLHLGRAKTTEDNAV